MTRTESDPNHKRTVAPRRPQAPCSMRPNRSIEATSQRPLHALWRAAHVELQGLPFEVKR